MKAYIFGLLIKLNAVSAWWASWGPKANEKGCEDVTQANINPKTTGGVGFNLGIRLQGCVVMMPRIVSPTMWQHKTITATTWTQLLITQGFAFVLRRARKHTHTSAWGLREKYMENEEILYVNLWHVGGVGVINESYLPRLFLGCHAHSPTLACLRHAILSFAISGFLFFLRFNLTACSGNAAAIFFSLHCHRWCFRHFPSAPFHKGKLLYPYCCNPLSRPSHYLAQKSLACRVYLLMSVK